MRLTPPGRRPRVQKIPASGASRMDRRAADVGGPGAVVEAVSMQTEFPLPAPIWDGVKVQVVAAGAPEHVKFTALGKEPVFGFTATV